MLRRWGKLNKRKRGIVYDSLPQNERRNNCRQSGGPSHKAIYAMPPPSRHLVFLRAVRPCLHCRPKGGRGKCTLSRRLEISHTARAAPARPLSPSPSPPRSEHHVQNCMGSRSQSFLSQFSRDGSECGSGHNSRCLAQTPPHHQSA